MQVYHRGLTNTQVIESRNRHGDNSLPEHKSKSLFDLFIDQFRSPLVLVLLAVSLVTLYLKDYSDTIIILFVVVLNAIIGVVEHNKANNVMQSLRKLSRATVSVLRSGILEQIPLYDVVVGDYVALKAGDIVPADGVIVEHSNLRIDESKVNGESMPASKGDTPESTTVFRSTVVVSGSAIICIEKVGVNTVIGQLSITILDNVENETVLERKIAKLVQVILYAVSASMVVLVLVGIVRSMGLFDLFKTAISMTVSAVPEGLPIVVTVVLAVGAWRISRVGGLLKNLPSGATLATVSHICTDKTGTLTKGIISLKEIKAVDGVGDDDLKEYVVHSLDIKTIGGVVTGDILDTTLSTTLNVSTSWLETKELPFSSESKYNAKEYNVDGRYIQIYKGAPELFTDNDDLYKQYVVEGYRVLGLARRVSDTQQEFDSSQAQIIGMIVFEDPIRSDVAEAIDECKQAGITVMMITGDNILTATHVARQVGILTGHTDELVLEGSAIEQMSDDELQHALSSLKVVARARPLDKLRIVKVLQQGGHRVAMTGDGVNDGPAIALADIGIAMGRTGTEVAKEAADFILVEDSFLNIRDGIFEARTIIENIRKTLVFLLSTSLAEILIIIGCLLVGYPLPLLPVQILWLNLITDGFLTIPLAQEPTESVYRTYSYKRYHGGLLKAYDYYRMGVMSLTMVVVSMVGFVIALRSMTLAAARTVMLMIMTVVQWANAQNTRKHTASLFSYNFFENKYILIAIAIEAALLLGGIYTPLGNRLLATVPVDIDTLLTASSMALMILVTDEVYKALRR